MGKWTETEINEAIKLLKNKFSYLQISIELDKTLDAVRNKLSKLGYKSSNENKEIRQCLCCGEKIHVTVLQEKKFCNRSCSAKFNNKTRKLKRKKTIKECLTCKKSIGNSSIFCGNKCHSVFNKKTNFEKIKNGDVTLYEKWYKLFLIEEHGDKCMSCGWDKIHPITGKVPIQLEHIDGNSENNELSNLKLLCPNCHSLTPTYGALNKGNGRKKRQEARKKIK